MRDKGLNIIIGVLIILILGLSIYLMFFNKEPEITSVKLSKNNLNLYIGSSEKIDVLLENINLDDLLWKSDNELVASVMNGVIKGNNAGSTTITVYTKNGKINDKCIVEVSKKVIEGIEFDKKNIELLVGNTEKINATIIPDELKNEKLNWLSDNESIAIVDGNGVVTGVGEGKTTIKATGGNAVSECEVKVSVPEPIVEPIPKEEPVKEEIPKQPEKKPTPEPPKTSSKVEMHFINADSYYDDAILIRSDKATIFIDGGRGKNAVIKYLNDLRIKTIDYVIGSHTEYDHIDAQGEVIRQFDVKHALYPNSITNCGCSCESKDVRNVTSALGSKNMQPEVQSVPSKLVIGDMTLYFIAPFKIGCNKNNNSFIFILQFGNNKFMFTGDADSVFNNENQLVANAKSLGLSGIEVDVFKYPHHGNETLSDKLFDTMNVKSIIVPNVNASQHPSVIFREKMNKKGIKVYRQSDSKTGNILITSDGNNIDFTMDVMAITYAK